MSRQLVIYVDGAHQVKNKQHHVLAWGLVALHDDEHHELHGQVLAPWPSPIGSCHEQIAFVQAVLYADQHGFAPEDVSIFCDDDIFGYAPFFLHPGNYKASRADQVMTRLHQVARHAFTREVKDLVLEAFQKSRITKLKGHSEIVYQERVDYLAKHALRTALNPEVDRELLSMDDWLGRGLVIYEPIDPAVLEADTAGDPLAPQRTHTRLTWRAAFVSEPEPKRVTEVSCT